MVKEPEMRLLYQVISAIDKRDLKTVLCLLAEHPYFFHFEIPQGWPIMHRCLIKRCVDMRLMKMYVARGGNVNRRTNSGVSLAFLAATMSGSQEIFKFLTSLGSEMSEFEKVLTVILKEENEARVAEKVAESLNKTPELTREVGDNGFTLLHHAVENFRYETVNVLLERGSDPNALTWTGRSVLGFCDEPIDSDGMACYELLVVKGATYTPFERLVKMIRDDDVADAVKLLEKRRELLHAWLPLPMGPLLHIAVWLSRGTKLVEYLLNRKLNPNIPNEQGETALHRAMHRASEIKHSTLDMIRLLVRFGAKFDTADGNGYTALHEAAKHPWEEPLKLLVELGASINAKTNDGQTVLDIVNETKFLGSKSLAYWLKRKGARSGKPGTK